MKNKFQDLVNQARSNNDINSLDLPDILMNADRNFNISNNDINQLKTQTENQKAILSQKDNIEKANNTKLLERISFLFVNKKYPDLVKLFEDKILPDIQELRSLPQSYQSLFTWSLFEIVRFTFF